MKIVKQTETSTKGLCERAMLAKLEIRRWSGGSKDSKTSEEVLINKKAIRGSGSWWTRIVPKKSLRPIQTVKDTAVKIHQKYTLPWDDNGMRILPAEAFLEYSKEMRAIKDDFEKAVNNFISEYPDLIKSAQKRLGGLWNPEKVPSTKELRSRYRWNIVILPLPNVSDFRVSLPDDCIEEVKTDMEERVNSLIKSALMDVWDRMKDVVEKVSEKMNDDESIFRDSLIGNIKEICCILPKLNITKDKDIQRVQKMIQKRLSHRKPDEIRNNKQERKKIQLRQQMIF